MAFNTLLHGVFRFSTNQNICPVTDLFLNGEVGVMSGLRHSVNSKNQGGKVAEALSRFSP